MKNTVATLQQQKLDGDKITMLTAYDYSTAKLMDEAGVNSILVGDSLGMVMLGYEDTISVTMEDMIHHTAAVSRGSKNALVVGDMPFMSYQTSVYDAVVNAGRLMKELQFVRRLRLLRMHKFRWWRISVLHRSQSICSAALRYRVKVKRRLKSLLKKHRQLKKPVPLLLY